MDNTKFKKFFQSNAHFRIENPNPLWKEKRGYIWDRGDCTIRALANSTGISWIEAFDYLASHARAEYNVMSDGKGFRRWLEDGGGIWTACRAERGKKRMTVLEFAKKHPNGRYVLRVANHEVAVVNGIILDAWNCGDRAVFGYLNMENFKLQ